MPLLAILSTLALPALTHALSCALTPDYEPPAVAPGYTLQLVVKGINTPRHITFDDRGNLLVAGDRSGIIALELAEGQDGCVEVMRRVVVAENGGLDLYHGVAVSGDGATM
jgi:hypothetical protein